MKNTYFPRLHSGFLGFLLLLVLCLIVVSATSKSNSEEPGLRVSSTAMQEKILGAELYYQQLENQQVQIFLTKYVKSVSNQLSSFETVALHEREAFMLHSTLQLERVCIQDVPSPETKPCGSAGEIKKVTYSAQTMLASMPGGFDITWGQYGIEESPMTNIESTTAIDIALSVHLPDPMAGLINSMPYLLEFPPHLICANEVQSIELQAEDSDGDQITYNFSNLLSPKSQDGEAGTLTTPILATDAVPVLPKITGRPPLKNIPFRSGFSGTHPLSKESCQLDAESGQLSLETTLSGQYLIGLTLKDYRQEKLLSEHQCVWLLEVL